tara:strand:- start:340 stop:576 length:237 start_codon:yes stop_codon:yes gene_type:complete
MKNETSYTLSDNVIGHIAKLLQLAMLSGTDIIDHLRMVKLEDDPLSVGSLQLTEEYAKLADMQVQKMLEELEDFNGQA